MGSFSSKVRSIRNGVSPVHEESTECINDGTERERHSSASISEMADNSTPRGQPGAKSGDGTNAGASSSHEQQAAPKVGQSFSWLASTPVVLNTTTKEHKAKGKRPVEGRKASGAMRYSNEKYLKSLQATGELLPSTQTSPSTSKEDYEASKMEKRSDNKKASHVSSSRSGNFPVGFGVVGKQVSPKLSAHSTLTVRKSQRKFLSLESKDEECP